MFARDKVSLYLKIKRDDVDLLRVSGHFYSATKAANASGCKILTCLRFFLM